MKRNGQYYKNYYNTKPNEKHLLLTGNLTDVLIDDFREYLEDHHIDFISNEAEKRINDYIMYLFYQMQDEIPEAEDREKLENIFKTILYNTVTSLPF